MKQGWEVKKLGEICGVTAGQSPEGRFYNLEGKGLPFYQGKKEFSTKFIKDPRTWTTKITKEAEKDDILMSVRAPVGAINISTQKICIGRGLAAIRAGSLINKEFLFNFLIKQQDKIIGNSGAVFNSINKSQIEDIKIPTPPLEEQKQIVAILDKAFAKIEKSKEIAQQNLKNAKELFESYLQEVFENKGDDWTEMRFCELIEKNQIGLIKTTREQGDEKKYRYLKMDSITSDNSLIHNKYVYVDATVEELQKFSLNEGDFLFNTRNSYDLVGKTCIYTPIDDEPTLFNNNIMRVRFKKDYSSKFINYAFSLALVKVRLQKLKSGTTSVVGIYYKGLKNLLIPVTNYKRQQNIVRKLDDLCSQTQKLETIYQQKLTNLEELKKSILQKAFNGELTTI